MVYSGSTPNRLVLRGQTKILKAVIQNALVTQQLLAEKDVGAIYGIPAEDYQSIVTYKPTVRLLFIEPFSPRLQELNLNQAKAEISFRLMNYTPQTINHEAALIIAERIKTFFAEGMGFTWEKGTTKVRYHEPHAGYDLRVYASSEAEGTRVIRQVLEINEHLLNEQLITVRTTHKVYPIDPGYQEIYTVQVKAPRKFPTTEVRFNRAELYIWGLLHPITLIDLSRKKKGLVAY